VLQGFDAREWGLFQTEKCTVSSLLTRFRTRTSLGAMTAGLAPSNPSSRAMNGDLRVEGHHGVLAGLVR
jgi:hypothetical protein